ncbi:MAG: 2Fe-2S iron-sulfur cluster-binding protein [Cyanobacteria bacterium P01_F01_bin.33]
MAEYEVRLVNKPEGLDTIIEVDEDEYVLDAAEFEEIPLPFSCRSGVCSSCTGRVIQGDIDDSAGNPDMFFNQSQREAGLRLLCIGRPTSDCVVETHMESHIPEY